jgi:hypothetical protein
MRIKVQCAGQTPPNNSRRGFLKNAAALAAAAAPGKAVPQSKDSEIVERISRRNPDTNHRILLKGGTIVTMDPNVGDFVKGDLLIQGRKIAAVGASLQGSGEVIDASNTILIPGFVDCHRHSWEGVLRRIIPNGDIGRYMATTHQGFALRYRPHDMYLGNLVTGLGSGELGVGPPAWAADHLGVPGPANGTGHGAVLEREAARAGRHLQPLRRFAGIGMAEDSRI